MTSKQFLYALFNFIVHFVIYVIWQLVYFVYPEWRSCKKIMFIFKTDFLVWMYDFKTFCWVNQWDKDNSWLSESLCLSFAQVRSVYTNICLYKGFQFWSKLQHTGSGLTTALMESPSNIFLPPSCHCFFIPVRKNSVFSFPKCYY